MLREPVSRRRRGRGRIALDAKQEIGRDEQRLDPDGDPFVEGALLLLRVLRQVHVGVHLVRRQGATERAARQVRQDAPRTECRVGAGRVTAGVDLRDAVTRGAGHLRVRAAHVDRVDAHAVHRDLRERLLRVVERLLQLRDALRRGGGRRLEFLRRRNRAPGRPRSSVARRQPFEDARNGDRDVAIAGLQSRAELEGLPAEILAVVVEPRGALQIEDVRVHLLVVHPECDRDRLRSGRTQAAQANLDHILRIHRHAEHRMERVRQAQSGDVVVAGERPRVADTPAVGAQARERRLHRRRPVERETRDPVRRRDVLLHQHRRQRQDVSDVVEPVSRIVLREIVGGMGVDAEQIANRVVVLGAVEAAGRHPSGIGRRQAIDVIELLRKPTGNRLTGMFGGLRLFLRRHLAPAELLDDLRPALVIVDERGGRLERLEVQAVLLLLVAVALDAVLGHEWPHERIELISRVLFSFLECRLLIAGRAGLSGSAGLRAGLRRRTGRLRRALGRYADRE